METSEELAELMEELPGGENYGYRTDEGTRQPLNSVEMQRQDFLFETGAHVERGTAHRGVIHPDEYVDQFALRDMVCEELGFTYEQISSVYKEGRPKAELRELRGQIDARLLALSREGGNMYQLSEALGLESHTIYRAIRRAEEAE